MCGSTFCTDWTFPSQCIFFTSENFQDSATKLYTLTQSLFLRMRICSATPVQPIPYPMPEMLFLSPHTPSPWTWPHGTRKSLTRTPRSCLTIRCHNSRYSTVDGSSSSRVVVHMERLASRFPVAGDYSL